ncbi:MAG: flap endonuclease-1 [Candidatus Hydrothermarchaeota archaeon]|nr:flap endonuclease-1 [Candidatus Hydrothermarchaeota archaeon]
MGVQLADLISPKPIEFEAMMGKKIAIDAMNSLYQFLSIIRQPTGELLSDSAGRITSHLSGLFYRNIHLLEYGILPIYVFDGKPPGLKGEVVEKRSEIREVAREKWKTALAEQRYEEAKLYAQQSSRINEEMLLDSNLLLEYMGIPCVQAPSEGEAQAASVVLRNDAWAVGSQDYDSLLFGSPRLVRNLTISGRRKLPRRNAYIDIKPEIFYLEDALRNLGINREQLIEIGILIGTDYNPKGVEGIGPKKAYSLVKEFGSAKSALQQKNISVHFDVDEIKNIFLSHETTKEYKLEWNVPNEEKLIEFLCEEHDFSRERVKNALEKLRKSEEIKRQRSLDAWFKT